MKLNICESHLTWEFQVTRLQMGWPDDNIEWHGQMTVANDNRILADLLIHFKLWYWSNLDGQAEEGRFLTTISRVMSRHCSIRAHLE
jgi:hypothetical protein